MDIRKIREELASIALTGSEALSETERGRRAEIKTRIREARAGERRAMRNVAGSLGVIAAVLLGATEYIHPFLALGLGATSIQLIDLRSLGEVKKEVKAGKDRILAEKYKKSLVK